MKTRVDEPFRLEVERLRLRFGCEHCAYFEPRGARCSEGYPNAAHHAVSLQEADTLLFCKRFELA